MRYLKENNYLMSKSFYNKNIKITLPLYNCIFSGQSMLDNWNIFTNLYDLNYFYMIKNYFDILFLLRTS